MPLVIFDVDGTLVDSQDGIVEAQARAFAAVGLPAPSRQRSLSIVGLSLHEAFSVLVGPDGPVSELTQAYREAWTVRHASGAQDPLFPGAQDALRAIKQQGFRLGIATGKARRGIARLIADHGWHDVFDTVQTADDAPSKPAPDMILRALVETETPAGDALMIGDSTFDMTMAQAARVESIGVTWGYHAAAALKAAGARTLVNDFAALVAHLAQRGPGRGAPAAV